VIPTIGVMVGAYIFTRMIDIFCRPATEKSAGYPLLALVAAGTSIVTVLCVLDLLISGTRNVLPTP
jgi:formate-dependent nitrite reductase membrane component NrfD